MKVRRHIGFGLLVSLVSLGATAAPVSATSALDEIADLAAPTDEGGEITNTIRWKSRRENGIYGYLVYRSDRREGPFLRVSRNIVRISNEPQEIHAYVFVDKDVEPGRTYYYYLDLVRNSGVKERFSGVVSKTTGGLSEDQ